MRNIFNKMLQGTNHLTKSLMWFLVVLITMMMNLEVVIKMDWPDWIGIISIIIFLYMFIRYSKKVVVIFDLLLCAVFFCGNAVLKNGVEECKQILYDFYVNTGSWIIVWVIVIVIAYAMWKSRKK